MAIPEHKQATLLLNAAIASAKDLQPRLTALKKQLAVIKKSPKRNLVRPQPKKSPPKPRKKRATPAYMKPTAAALHRKIGAQREREIAAELKAMRANEGFETDIGYHARKQPTSAQRKAMKRLAGIIGTGPHPGYNVENHAEARALSAAKKAAREQAKHKPWK